MQNKSTKKLSFTAKSAKNEFGAERLTLYSGLSVISDFIKRCGI
ncbi:MAG TPA: hypothetical protein PLS84_00825 [Salinivirgaceae bacterium]|nr:hypothetical protein [Salinivirgaceae bacterium]